MIFVIRLGEIVDKVLDVRSETNKWNVSAAAAGRRTLDVSGQEGDVLRLITSMVEAGLNDLPSAAGTTQARGHAALRMATASAKRQVDKIYKFTMCAACSHPMGAHSRHSGRCTAGDPDVGEQFHIVEQDDRCACLKFVEP